MSYYQNTAKSIYEYEAYCVEPIGNDMIIRSIGLCFGRGTL